MLCVLDCCMYDNIPSVSGIHVSPSKSAALSGFGVHYLKDTTGNAPAYGQLLFSIPIA